MGLIKTTNVLIVVNNKYVKDYKCICKFFVNVLNGNPHIGFRLLHACSEVIDLSNGYVIKSKLNQDLLGLYVSNDTIEERFGINEYPFKTEDEVMLEIGHPEIERIEELQYNINKMKKELNELANKVYV